VVKHLIALNGLARSFIENMLKCAIKEEGEVEKEHRYLRRKEGDK